jgi:hypothetical protein
VEPFCRIFVHPGGGGVYVSAENASELDNSGYAIF